MHEVILVLNKLKEINNQRNAWDEIKTLNKLNNKNAWNKVKTINKLNNKNAWKWLS